MLQIRRALISVSDKRGVVEFARALRSLDVDIISTGGTATVLKENGVDVRSVSDVTGFPEILNGRVKTLHPKIHGGLLAVTDNPEHVKQLDELDIEPIDMVVVNLYPFEQTISRIDISLEEAVEQIDIGGPAMLRSAGKNFRHKAVVVNPDRYEDIQAELERTAGSLSEETCLSLAREVFRHTARYDSVISSYLDRGSSRGPLPDTLALNLPKEHDLRYGENPHQSAALYGSFGRIFHKLHGKELSYNNIVDISTAGALVAEFDVPTTVIVKHANPCGVGSGGTIAEAYEKALATDRTSAFGGIVAVNRPVDAEAVDLMSRIFTEVIIAPGFPDETFDVLRQRKDRRLIRSTATKKDFAGVDMKSVPSGVLVQTPDHGEDSPQTFRVVTRRQPTEQEMRAMQFGWKVARYVKSNAIVYAREDRTVGIGAGQMSRVDSARIAAAKAKASGLDIHGTAVASDAFFPFPDGLLEAADAGSTAVIQPGGSIRDTEVIEAADRNNLAMVFTGRRHFRH